MKHLLLTTITAVLMVGCGESQQSAPVAGHQSYPVSEVDSGLLDAAENGNLEAVQKHLAAGMDFELKCAGCGGTALLHAAFGGHKEIVELLIAKGADVNAKNDSGRTSLNWADKEIADLLRKHGGKTGEELDISIHDAAYEGNIEAVKQHIADGADVNAKGKYGWAPLHYASDGEGKKNVVELLIANDADVNAKDDDGSTPLHVAAYNGHKEIVVLLIDAGANVNAQDVLGSNKGNTPLNAASEENHPEIADLLREHGGKTGAELKAEGKKSNPKQSEPAKEDKKLWAKSYLNKKAPELIVEKWLSEKPEWKGKFLLVDFWATWCGPCLKAIPELNRFHEQFGKQMVVVGLSDEQESKVASMKQPQIEYYSAIDTQKRMKNEVKVTGIPHVMIIDPQGIVRWEGFPFLSGHELTEEVVENILRKHGGKTGEELKAEGK